MYFKQLDSLRAIAVIMVFSYHWLPSIDLFQVFQIGPLGVSAFFVLSGFLITRILIKNKQDIDLKKISIGQSLKIFYLRRSIRIFPIYYLLLAFLFLLNFETVRSEILWHAVYGSNFLYVITGEFSSGLSHLWSLSVEEQFYLIWPIFLIIIPIKHLKLFLISTIIIGVICYLLLIKSLPNGSLLVFARIDAFAWGGLLAYLMINSTDINKTLRKYKWILYPAVVLFIVMHYTDLGVFGSLRNSVFYVICFFIIAKMVIGVTGLVGKILDNRILIYVGKISYGIYLYHNLMQWLVPYFSDLLNIPFPSRDHEYYRFIIYLILTLVVSSASWYFVERPLNRLKKKHF